MRTVESLDEGGCLNTLQRSFHERHALQCGFCTPAFLMMATTLDPSKDTLHRDEIRERLAGVLCRCTGYKKIVDAVEDWMTARQDPR